MTRRMKGTVVHYDHRLGLGAIDADDLDEPILVCVGAVQASGYVRLEQGDCVEFDVVQLRDNPAAVNLSRVEVES